ncbi:MAG: hypothetical protein ACI4U2_06630 [Christensenellaceae bacterium]
MKLYLTIIFLSILAIFGLHLPFTDWLTSLLDTGFAFLAVLAVDAIVALVVRYCCAKLMNPFAPVFRMGKREKRVYEKLGVRKWKDLIPETGKQLAGFAKDKIEEPDNNEYVLRFLKETCFAEVMHFFSIGLGFVILALPVPLSYTIPVAAVNALLQILPVCVQRYNRARLLTLYRYNERRAKRA